MIARNSWAALLRKGSTARTARVLYVRVQESPFTAFLHSFHGAWNCVAVPAPTSHASRASHRAADAVHARGWRHFRRGACQAAHAPQPQRAAAHAARHHRPRPAARRARKVRTYCLPCTPRAHPPHCRRRTSNLDVTPLLQADPKQADLGEAEIPALHLSERARFDASGFYHCCQEAALL